MENILNEIFQFIIGNYEKIEFQHYKKNPQKLQLDSQKTLCQSVLKYMTYNEDQTSECLNFFSSLTMNQILIEASENYFQNQDFNQRIEYMLLLSKIVFCRAYQRECIFKILKKQKFSLQYDIFEDLIENQNLLTFESFKKILQSLVAFFQIDPRGYHEIWDTSKFFELIIENNQLDEVRPFFNNLTIQIMQFNDTQKKKYLNSLYHDQEKLFSDNQEVQFYLQSLSFQESNKSIEISDFQKKKVKQSIFEEQQLLKYVQTRNSQHAIQQLQTALLTNNFLILDGPISSGKSTIIQQCFQEADIIRVYLDNTTDLKSLIGSYVCSEKIGHFEWRCGPLAQTMMNGSILILENFQESNQEVINGLISVIEQGSIDNMQGGILEQKTGFKIIGVSNFELQKDFEFQSKKQLLLKAAEFIKIPSIQMDDIELIILTKFPNIQLVFKKIKEIFSNLLSQGQKYKNLMINNPKRLIALCNRINIHQTRFYGQEGILNNLLTLEFRKIILLEIIDCFLLQEKNLIHDKQISDVILKSLDLQQEELDYYLTQYCPIFETSSLQISFERIGLLQRDHFGKSGGDQSKDDIFQIIYNSYSSRLLEKIASCLYFDDPCLLIGDTGCGKTTLTQHFAKLFQKKLHVYNMNQGSDAVDLIGGFKPIEIKILIKNVLIKYVQLFETVANMKSNQKYLSSLTQLYESSSYNALLKCMLDSLVQIKEKIQEKELNGNFDFKKNFKRFNKIEKQIQNIYANRDKIESNLAFHFVEGNLINAMKQGDWILIDEINLANNEVLQRILPIIEGESLILYDRGDIKSIKRHKDFRVIGCMNPGSDIGKKELPQNIKSKFIQIFVHEIEQRQDIQMLVSQKVGKLVGQNKVDQIRK